MAVRHRLKSATAHLADGTGQTNFGRLEGALNIAEAPRTALTPAGTTSAGLLVDAFDDITASVAGALADRDACPGILGDVTACTARYLQLVVGQFAIGG